MNVRADYPVKAQICFRQMINLVTEWAVSTMNSFLPAAGIAILLFLSGCGSPPAMETDEAHTAADALYTAVTSRRLELLDQVARHLQELNTNQKLTPEALAGLSAIVDQARSGKWQAAAEDLDHFIRYQSPHQHSH